VLSLALVTIDGRRSAPRPAKTCYSSGMATTEFILQGFTASTHVDALQRLFDLPDIQKVLVSVAFVTEGGVEQIEAQLIAHSARATVFAGIRNDTTSYQGLARLHRIVSELYTVDTGSRTVIFHPKLYLVRGKEHARLVISSANLTLAGLNNNIEAGMLLEFDLTDAADKAEIDKIEMLFAASLTDYPSHVVKVTNIANLDELLAAGRLIDENVGSLSPDAFGGDSSNCAGDRASDGVPRIKLKAKLLRSGIARTNSVQKEMEHGNAPAVASQAPGPPMPASGVESEPKGATTFGFSALRKRSRSKEGPRLIARRARMEAKALGRKWYFTGQPCKYGHKTDRLVSNGKCRECSRQDSEFANRHGFYR
jgi:HKD family nuclease